MVEVILAGYNVDKQALEELVGRRKITPDDLENFLTPETISAAYARISRDPRPVTELRESARKEVEKSRKSNQNIVFKMGHHSVAEHAVLNFDILGISRLAIEALEAQRLCSFTEKSQRYITMKGDYVMPKEFKAFESEFRNLVGMQNKAYDEFYTILKCYFQNDKDKVQLAEQTISAEEEQQAKKFPDNMRMKKLDDMLDGWAKEDARYVICMATEGQLGFTTNARDLEKFIKYCAVHPLNEVQELGNKLHNAGKQIIPSLLLFTEPNDYFKKSRQRVNEYIQKNIGDLSVHHAPFVKSLGDFMVRLIEPDTDADNKLVATFIQKATNNSFNASYSKASNLSQEKKQELIKKVLEGIEQWDAVPREFEIPSLTYELVMSASSFAQFKRHRMLTLLPLQYIPEKFGYTIPPSIKTSGLEPKFRKIMQQIEKLYYDVKQKNPEAAPYVLTNAHNRRMLVKLNARELYHVSRLREDLHAQWEIREKARQMTQLAKKVMPLTTLLLGGKHEFQKIYNKTYSTK